MMKHTGILAIAALMLVSASLSAQDGAKKEVGGYAGISLSTSNGDGLGNVMYPSVEGGVAVSNWTLGLCAGRRDLAAHEDGDQASDYFYEPKATVSMPIGAVNGFALFGAGGFFDTETYFIEYGFGVGWPCGPVTLSTQYSNWAGADYVSLGVSTSF